MKNLSEFTKDGFTVQVADIVIGTGITGTDYLLMARENNISTSKVWSGWKEIPFNLKVPLIKMTKADSSKNAEIYFDLIN